MLNFRHAARAALVKLGSTPPTFLWCFLRHGYEFKSILKNVCYPCIQEMSLAACQFPSKSERFLSSFGHMWTPCWIFGKLSGQAWSDFWVLYAFSGCWSKNIENIITRIRNPTGSGPENRPAKFQYINMSGVWIIRISFFCDGWVRTGPPLQNHDNENGKACLVLDTLLYTEFPIHTQTINIV